MSLITAATWEQLAGDFYQYGWVWVPHFLSAELTCTLNTDLQQQRLRNAGVGRQQDHIHNQQIRRDQTAWLDGSSQAQQDYLQLMQQLQKSLNQRFFLGLFDYECHYARYQQGDFYQKHLDAFRGRSNRVLTTVTYLNTPASGGELLLYDEHDTLLKCISPSAGGLVLFESERFPHEVLPASSERLSIAGWFRRNNSLQGIVDPGN